MTLKGKGWLVYTVTQPCDKALDDFKGTKEIPTWKEDDQFSIVCCILKL